MRKLSTGTLVAVFITLAYSTTVEAVAAGCKSGFVWRDAQDGDGVCVTPHEREQAKRQNAMSPSRTAN